MRARFVLLPLIVCGVAWLGGYAARRVAVGSSDPQHGGSQPGKLSERQATPELLPPAALPVETMQDVLALPGPTSYMRTVQWLTHATAEEMASFSEAWKKRPGEDKEAMNELILLNWTRIDPRGAIAAVKDLPGKRRAFAAWAASDPEAALKTALEENPYILPDAVEALGRYHPDWLRSRPADIPAALRTSFLDGLSASGGGSDPEAALNFANRYGKDLSRETLVRWTELNPQAAYGWLMANRRPVDFSPSGVHAGSFQEMAATIAATQPELAKTLAQQTPPGEDRRIWDGILFDRQIADNPAAAEEQALATKNPRTAVERLSKIVTSLAGSDSGKAMELTGQIFRIKPDAMSLHDRTINGISYPGEIDGLQPMIQRLIMTNPEGLMELSFTLSAGENGQKILDSLQNCWAERDLYAYTAWADRQQEPERRKQTQEIVLDGLIGFERYEEATQRAMANYAAAPESAGKSDEALIRIFQEWHKERPDAALRWLEQAPLKNAEKADLEKASRKSE